jgi:hypothetical protein
MDLATGSFLFLKNQRRTASCTVKLKYSCLFQQAKILP